MNIVELNIDLGTDPACVAHKIGLITGWLSFRRPQNATVFCMQLFEPCDKRPEFMLAVRTQFKSTQGLGDFYNLADMLRQDCIAVWVVDNPDYGSKGFLIGPNRLDWGDFDVKKFVRIKL